jgi:oxygen-independent coproporphyrinogen-3 oxidase
MPAWQARIQPYLDRLEKEIIMARNAYGKPFETIFVGGGNPGNLTVAQLAHLLRSAGPSKETTFEINPESFTEKHLDLFSSGLANRLSMGIQSMDNATLSLLGRHARRNDNLRALRLACQLPTDCRLSFDLMEGLPGQTPEGAKADIDEVVDIAHPTHLSLYCLTLEEGTRLTAQVRGHELSVPDDDQMADNLGQLWQYLASKGFHQYEVSNFAKEGAACFHNQRYWRLQPYLGLGCSAASTLREKSGNLLRLTVRQQLPEYLEGAAFSGFELEELDRKKEAEEYLLVKLRTAEGIDRKQFKERFGFSFSDLLERAAYINPSWYTEGKNTFSLTREGLLVSDAVILTLALALDRI